MTAPPRRCRCGHPGEKASRALPSGRPSGLPPRNAPPSAPTPRPGTPTCRWIILEADDHAGVCFD